MQALPVIRVYAERLRFVIPYIKRELKEWAVVGPDDDGVAAACVAIQGLDEEPLAGVPAGTTVLVCPNVVGTGMIGLPMLLAEAVANGRLFHIIGNETRLSTVHASDVAKAVRASLGDGGRYFVSDGVDPTFDDFADALAARINDKRILTLKPWQARWLMSKRLRSMVTTDSTVDCSIFHSKFDFVPTPVTQYLRTHVYDENSL